MSLYGTMRTSVSGMAAQANKLGTIGDNIANANTTGYKRASTEFSTLVISNDGASYNSGGVNTDVRYAISQQGTPVPTTSPTDLAIEGDGFFVVSNDAGTPLLTRAGSFVPDSTGKLVNAAGYTLMGYALTAGSATPVVNALAGLQPVDITMAQLGALPSTSGTLFANLPSNGAITPAANLPSTNAAGAQWGAKTSLVAYDNLGNQVLLDVYFAKSAANTWEVTAFDRAGATGGGFPYAGGALVSQTLTFDPTTGDLATASPDSLTLTVPNGAALTIDLSQMTQLAADFTMMAANVDGSAPSPIVNVEITQDGTVVALLENGARQPYYKIPLADVPSPDRLLPVTGTAYTPTNESGDVMVGTAATGGFGDIISGALEQSNVDMASELVSMIEAQRGYTANSKVFQTGAELLDVLINLKR